MWCSDPFVNSLKAFGYSMVRLPKADLAPLQLLLGGGRDLERLGDIATVLVASANLPAPRIARDRPAASISGRRTGSLDASLGLSLLCGIVAAMGGSEVGLDQTYRSARTLTFEFREVTEDSVPVVELDQYLAGARIRVPSSHVASLLDADDLYVTTAVLRSRTLTVRAQDEQGASVAIQLPQVQQLVGGRLGVSWAGDAASALVYTGTHRLGFGFRAVRLFYEDGRFQAFRPLAPGAAALAREENAPEWLRTDGAFAVVRDVNRVEDRRRASV
jgi:hypothetical protein